mmetsp:Transcript_4302/g.5074  ORF Transcript_4302/g.5074 Transcript_4302/m.5074 type:complete len:200 (+) Transcript_4302:160-759(+)
MPVTGLHLLRADLCEHSIYSWTTDCGEKKGNHWSNPHHAPILTMPPRQQNRSPTNVNGRMPLRPGRILRREGYRKGNLNPGTTLEKPRNRRIRPQEQRLRDHHLLHPRTQIPLQHRLPERQTLHQIQFPGGRSTPRNYDESHGHRKRCRTGAAGRVGTRFHRSSRALPRGFGEIGDFYTDAGAAVHWDEDPGPGSPRGG